MESTILQEPYLISKFYNPKISTHKFEMDLEHKLTVTNNRTFFISYIIVDFSQHE